MNATTVDEIPDFEITPEQKESIAGSVADQKEQKEMDALEEKHAKENTFSDDYVVEAFPTEQYLVVERLEGYWKEAREQFIKVKKIRNITDYIQNEPFSKWFFLNVEKYEAAMRLKWLYQQIKRLEKLKVTYEKKRIEALLQFTKFETKEEKKRFNIDKMFERENLLVDIASFDGIRLRGAGSRYMGKCPFHNEKTGSFAIYEDNWYHCFGCQAHGNFIDYLMKTRNIEFKEALAEANRFL